MCYPFIKMLNKKLIVIFVVAMLVVVFALPKEMSQGNSCLGWETLLTDKNNPFSYISEELAARIEIEKIYHTCFGISY